MPKELSLEEFRRDVLTDYGRCCVAAALTRPNGETRGELVHAGYELAEAAWARVLLPGDNLLTAVPDVALELCRGGDVNHVWQRALVAPAAVGFLARACGQLLALTEQPNNALALCTARATDLSRAELVECLDEAVSRRLALCIVVWQNDELAAQALRRVAIGIRKSLPTADRLLVETLTAADYPTLCRSVLALAERARKGACVLCFVQPAPAALIKFAEWMTSAKIGSPEQIAKLRAEAEQTATQARRAAMLSQRALPTPQLMPLDTALAQAFAQGGHPVVDVTPGGGDIIGGQWALGLALGLSDRHNLATLVSSAQWIRNYMNGHSRVVVRTVDPHCGLLLTCTDLATIIWTPATADEVIGAYRQASLMGGMHVVLECGYDKTAPDSSDSSTACLTTSEPTKGLCLTLNEGPDITLLSYGAGTPYALDLARRLAPTTRCEVLHLCTLRPLDENDVVANSLRKTKRLLVIDPDPTAQAAELIIGRLIGLRSSYRHLVAPVDVARLDHHDAERHIAVLLRS